MSWFFYFISYAQSLNSEHVWTSLNPKPFDETTVTSAPLNSIAQRPPRGCTVGDRVALKRQLTGRVQEEQRTLPLTAWNHGRSRQLQRCCKMAIICWKMMELWNMILLYTSVTNGFGMIGGMLSSRRNVSKLRWQCGRPSGSFLAWVCQSIDLLIIWIRLCILIRSSLSYLFRPRNGVQHIFFETSHPHKGDWLHLETGHCHKH